LFGYEGLLTSIKDPLSSTNKVAQTSYRDDYIKMIALYNYWTNKLGPFPFSPSPLKPFLTFSDTYSVFVWEGENQGGGHLKVEDLNGRGVQVNCKGSIFIGNWKNGEQDGLHRYIWYDGSEWEDCEFRSGMKHGKYVAVYEDGSTMESNYKDDNEHGESKFWKANG
jgi:hypothetical protein